MINSILVTKEKEYIRRIELSTVIKQCKARAERVLTVTKKVISKNYSKSRRSLKKTFSKKRNQRRAIYIGSAIVIVSLLFGILLTTVNAAQDKHQMNESIQRVQTEKRKQIETLSQELETIKEQKAVTETELKQKADSEAQKASEIEKLKADLQAKVEAEKRIAAAPAGGRGGSYSGVSRGSSDGNTYDYGYCTWYVKNRRPDFPNGMGNANRWYANAQAVGLPTGSQPRAGAIGTTTAGSLGHVVYVEAVNGDGTIQISEMNYQGWNVQSSRTASADSFYYIY